MTSPFIVFALPRSRTFWMSHFLNYGIWKCHHDICVDLHSIKELQDFFSNPNVGTVETGMVVGWEIAEALFPEARRVVIKRPVCEVSQSLAKHNIFIDDQLLDRREKLDQLSLQSDVLNVTFDELNEEETCRKIFEFCLQQPFDRDWWLSLKDQNIQIDMQEHLEKLNRHMPGIQRLHSEMLTMVA